MPNGEDKAAWRLFELHYQNLLSISKAQKVHLTTLLIEMTLFWLWCLSGSKDMSVQGVSLSADAVWLTAPAILTFFTLALIGSINAALPANHRLQEIAKRTIHLNVPCEIAFYDLDTDKNVLDYLTFLKLSATNNRFDRKHKYGVGPFLYPAVILSSLVSTGFALFHIPRTWLAILYSMSCMTLQLSFARRPFWRAVRRFRGDPTMDIVPTE